MFNRASIVTFNIEFGMCGGFQLPFVSNMLVQCENHTHAKSRHFGPNTPQTQCGIQFWARGGQTDVLKCHQSHVVSHSPPTSSSHLLCQGYRTPRCCSGLACKPYRKYLGPDRQRCTVVSLSRPMHRLSNNWFAIVTGSRSLGPRDGREVAHDRDGRNQCMKCTCESVIRTCRFHNML